MVPSKEGGEGEGEEEEEEEEGGCKRGAGPRQSRLSGSRGTVYMVTASAGIQPQRRREIVTYARGRRRGATFHPTIR
jgi:hypothetical protein